MEISDLKIFDAVAECGSITLAAKKLHRVPSNISTRIQKLEQSIGQSLFTRDSNRLKISQAGESLHSYAKQILALADQAIMQFEDPSPRGTLRIGSMEAVAATYLSQYLSAYHHDFPDVTLNVKTQHTDGLIKEVLNSEVDLALVANPNEHPALNRLLIINEPMVLVSSQNIRQLDSFQNTVTLLGFAQGCYYRKCLMQWAESKDLNFELHEIQSYHSMLNCASAGMGIGITPLSLLKQFHDKDNIKTHALPTSLKQTKTYLIWRKDNLMPSMEKFIDLFKQKKPSI